MNDKSHRLPKDVFNSQMVVAAIHRGNAIWQYDVQSVTSAGKTLTINYSATSAPSDSASFACPLIISVPKAGYDQVRFVENGK